MASFIFPLTVHHLVEVSGLLCLNRLQMQWCSAYSLMCISTFNDFNFLQHLTQVWTLNTDIMTLLLTMFKQFLNEEKPQFNYCIWICKGTKLLTPPSMTPHVRWHTRLVTHWMYRREAERVGNTAVRRRSVQMLDGEIQSPNAVSCWMMRGAGVQESAQEHQRYIWGTFWTPLCVQKVYVY